MNRFLYISGVKDVSRLNPDSTLADLGLDSLMGTEIQQALEREFDFVLSSREIRLLTVSKLRELSNEAPVPDELNTSRNIIDEHSNTLQSDVQSVLKLMPDHCIVHLNNHNTSVGSEIPLFIVHSIERRAASSCPFHHMMPILFMLYIFFCCVCCHVVGMCVLSCGFNVCLLCGWNVCVVLCLERVYVCCSSYVFQPCVQYSYGCCWLHVHI